MKKSRSRRKLTTRHPLVNTGQLAMFLEGPPGDSDEVGRCVQAPTRCVRALPATKVAAECPPQQRGRGEERQHLLLCGKGVGRDGTRAADAYDVGRAWGADEAAAGAAKG